MFTLEIHKKWRKKSEFIEKIPILRSIGAIEIDWIHHETMVHTDGRNSTPTSRRTITKKKLMEYLWWTVKDSRP